MFLFLVDLMGIEPTTLRMRTVRSPKLSYKPVLTFLKTPAWYSKRAIRQDHPAPGGDGEDRTLDLLNAIQALSQLSYAPKQKCYCYVTILFSVFQVFFKKIF